MIGTATLLGYVPGVQLPSVEIGRGQTVPAKEPAATVRVDGTRPGALTVSTVLGVAVPVLPVSASVVDVRLDGQPLLYRVTEVNLGSRARHTLTVTCR
jgi:hypothetical protein